MVTMMKMNDDDDDEDGDDDDDEGAAAAAAAAAAADDTDDIDEEEGVKRPSSSLCSMLPSLLIPWVVKSNGLDDDGKPCRKDVHGISALHFIQNPLYDDALRETPFFHPTSTRKKHRSKGNAVRKKQREETTFARRDASRVTHHASRPSRRPLPPNHEYLAPRTI